MSRAQRHHGCASLLPIVVRAEPPALNIDRTSTEQVGELAMMCSNLHIHHKVECHNEDNVAPSSYPTRTTTLAKNVITKTNIERYRLATSM